MSHPLYSPGRYYSYPFGNTSAVCLTRDLVPEEDGRLLLLGCGDPRNILYTVFCEPHLRDRALDFTCCDMEPAVLARNALLLTMIADRIPVTTVIWDIFYDMYLDEVSNSALLKQCRKLIDCSTSIESWAASSYGSFLKMSTEYTLTELRRHWLLYADMQHLPDARLKAIKKAFADNLTRSDKITMEFGSLRSAGPLFVKALRAMASQNSHYWATGLTPSDSKHPSTKTHINATFAYSLAGEGFSAHYGTHPLVSFHFAPLFGNAENVPSTEDLVRAAKGELDDWCTALQVALLSSSPPVIRLFLGEATAVCRVLHAQAAGAAAKPRVPVAPWKAQIIHLNADGYSCNGAPTTFNVIDTSNLVDHLGMLNVLVAASPLLCQSTATSVIYTESLQFNQRNAVKDFANSLHADIETMSILLGLAPVDYVSGFSSSCNTHELLMRQSLSSEADIRQFHHTTTWKSPLSANDLASTTRACHQALSFHPHQLSAFLYRLYQKLYAEEGMTRLSKLGRAARRRAVEASNLVHYTRESFVLFVRIVKTRLCISTAQWTEVMDHFTHHHELDRSVLVDMASRQDLYAQLHYHGVYTAHLIKKPLKSTIFAPWDKIPSLVRVFLVIPREKWNRLQPFFDNLGTPLLQCQIAANRRLNIFSSLQIFFGSVVEGGTKGRPDVISKEDLEGRNGSSSLVVSFVIPATLLELDPVHDVTVCLSVQATAGIASLLPVLGEGLVIHSAPLMDKASVHLLPQEPLRLENPHVSPCEAPRAMSVSEIGSAGNILVEFDEQCITVTSMTCRISISNPIIQRVFRAGPNLRTAQFAPCTIRIHVSNFQQDIVFPFPVIETEPRIRLETTSLNVEVVIRVSTSQPDNIQPNLLSTANAVDAFRIWNIHRVNPASMPVLTIKSKEEETSWLNTHVSSMLTQRDRSFIRGKRVGSTLALVKDTIHSIFMHFSGIQGTPRRQVFALRDKPSTECDTIFFINNLRLDLSCHAVVCDGYVLPLTPKLMEKIGRPFSELVGNSDISNITVYDGEMRAWKQLLPALTERCRTSWRHGKDCEYIIQRNIPLSMQMHDDPLCSCGKGKETENLKRVNLWRHFAPYVTRIAISPLFPVSYVENFKLGGGPVSQCLLCGSNGQPKLMTCSRCKSVWYCSVACQKKDWKTHKPDCKVPSDAA